MIADVRRGYPYPITQPLLIYNNKSQQIYPVGMWAGWKSTQLLPELIDEKIT